MERCGRPSKADVLAERREAITNRERVARLAYEAAHGKNDDGTETLAARLKHDRSVYSSGPEPITEYSHPCVLCEFGLTPTELGRLEANGCEHVYDVRDAVRCGEVACWNHCGPVLLERLRTVLADFDEVRK
jgi:hypothetical protein